MPREQVYNQTMLILAGMLVIGFICNLLIRPVADKWFMNSIELANTNDLIDTQVIHHESRQIIINKPTQWLKVFLAWTVVAVPLGWGIYQTLINVSQFFS
jgi:hypothetical protein